MRRHRTTARGALLLLILALGTGTAAASPRPGPGQTPPPGPARTPIVFPVIGQTRYIRDFGDPRVNGSHQGTDIMSPRRSAVVAAEPGRVEWWTTSARAGCMLYLYGASGTTYLYIHLNNDVTLANDNRGRCARGVAYTVADGARVAAGAQIAWSGDSGDADGNPHTQFEVHPRDGAAVDPYPYLQAAARLRVPRTPSAQATQRERAGSRRSRSSAPRG